MFKTARIKLTAWYLLIIMLVSVSFSLAIYRVLTIELDRVEHMQRLRLESQLPFSLPDNIPFEFRQRLRLHFMIDPEIIEEVKNRLKMILLIINGSIFALSSLGGYLLAGRTLKPIKDMVEEQNRFITDASHELRTPITSLKTELEVNLRDKKITKDTKKILLSNLEDVNNLQKLSDNLIKLTQYQKTNGNITFEKTSLKEIIQEAEKRVTNLAKHKKISIDNKVADYSIQANRQSLIEAFVIFLDNAIKYSQKNKSISLSSKSKDSSIVISIKDEGVGIAREDIPYLFDRFYRADDSRTKSKIEGFGLGLSIAKQIIDKHNGRIKVESDIGKGTTFSIYLPLKHS